MLLIRTSKFPENAKPPFFAGYLALLPTPFRLGVYYSPSTETMRRSRYLKKYDDILPIKNTAHTFYTETLRKSFTYAPRFGR